MPISQTYQILDVITDALIEIGLLSPGEQTNLDPDLGQWALRKANYLLDNWASQRKYVYASTFQAFNLTAGLSPHTIGPNNATFAWNQRPVKIESWALVLNTGPTAVDLPHRPTRDKDWWAMQRVKTLQSNIPTDMYYEPDSPNGSCYFWPVPNAAYPVRMELWTLVSQYLTINDPIDGPGGAGILPPAYRSALMLTLAETLQTGGAKSPNPMLSQMAQAARTAVFGNNSQSPRSATSDAGMSPTRLGADLFNWETGNLT